MKAIIVEDEMPARIELNHFITHHSDIKVLSEFDNGVDVLKFLQRNEVDVIFLDINIPNLDGLTLAKTIHQFKQKPQIIFITAYEEHAVSAFELEAFDYILKPYSEERIISTLKRLNKHQFSQDPPRAERCNPPKIKETIALWNKGKLVIVNVKDIYYCEAIERETIVYTKNQTYIGKLTITELEKKLSTELFFKSHRSYLINLSKIKEIIPWFNSTYQIRFKDISNEAYVSRSKMKEFKELMGI